MKLPSRFTTAVAVEPSGNVTTVLNVLPAGIGEANATVPVKLVSPT